MRPRTAVLLRLALLPLLPLLPLIAAGAAVAQPVCDHLKLTAARLPLVFVDGFESGGTLPWSAPVVERFSAAATEDLVAETTLLGDASGEHLLTLRWLLPGEHLYQEAAVPFTSDPPASGAQGGALERRIPDYPFPVAVHAPGRGARAVAGTLVVEQRLPVAGTPILESAVLGRWQVLAYVDGQETPCMSAVEFELAP
jgi:hypothetical protein